MHYYSVSLINDKLCYLHRLFIMLESQYLLIALKQMPTGLNKKKY